MTEESDCVCESPPDRRRTPPHVAAVLYADANSGTPRRWFVAAVPRVVGTLEYNSVRRDGVDLYRFVPESPDCSHWESLCELDGASPVPELTTVREFVPVPLLGPADRYAADRVREEEGIVRRTRPEMLSRITEQSREKFAEEHRSYAERVILAARDRNALWKAYESGVLERRNPNSRKLFEAAAGVKLPDSNGATRKFVLDRLGADYVARKRDEADRAERGRQERRLAEREKADRERAAEFDGFAADLPARFRERAYRTLETRVNFGGKSVALRELIRDRVREGYFVSESPTDFDPPRRVLIAPNGSGYFREKELTKTGLDYAAYLSGGKDRGEPVRPVQAVDASGTGGDGGEGPGGPG